MPHLRVLICQVDDATADVLTELAAFDLPTRGVATLQATNALDELEATTLTVGNAILRRLLQAEWELLDSALAEAYRQQQAAGAVIADGHEPLTIVSRFGTLQLRRQVLAHAATTSCLGMPCCRRMRAWSPHGVCRSGPACCPGAAVCRRGPLARLADPGAGGAVGHDGRDAGTRAWPAPSARRAG